MLWVMFIAGCLVVVCAAFFAVNVAIKRAMIGVNVVSGAQVRILVIDDEENIRDNLFAILKGEGYFVDTAETGSVALTKLIETYYNLVVVDTRLPDMDGIELLTKIPDVMPKIRKVMLTGSPTLENAVSSVNFGADAYVMKPYDVENLLKIIREQLDKQNHDYLFSCAGDCKKANVLFIGAHPDDIEWAAVAL